MLRALECLKQLPETTELELFFRSELGTSLMESFLGSSFTVVKSVHKLCMSYIL